MPVRPARRRPAAHLYLTQAWRDHGWQLWDNFWYAGRYAQVNYSLLFYPLAALAGTAPRWSWPPAAAAAAAFAALVRRRWPRLATGPAVAFALLVPLAVVAGTYPFLLGLALALGALLALAAGRPGAGAGWPSSRTALAHPLALAFLLVVLVARGALSTPGLVALARQRGAGAGRRAWSPWARRGCCCAASRPTAPTTRSTPRTRWPSPRSARRACC